MEEGKVIYKGLSFPQILTILFIILKLTDVINWSWFWVLSPILLPLIVVGAMLTIYLIALLALNIYDIFKN